MTQQPMRRIDWGTQPANAGGRQDLGAPATQPQPDAQEVGIMRKTLPAWLTQAERAILTIGVVAIPVLVDNHLLSMTWGAAIGSIIAGLSAGKAGFVITTSVVSNRTADQAAATSATR